MKTHFIALALFSLSALHAQTTGQAIIATKTAAGRTETGITLSDGQAIGKSGGVLSALNVQPLDSGLTALVGKLSVVDGRLVFGDPEGDHVSIITTGTGSLEVTDTVIAGALVGDGNNITNLNGGALAMGSVAMNRLAQGGATTGQAIVWNGSTYAPTTISSGITIGTTAITSATTGAPTVRMIVKANGNINMTLPTSSAGLSSGDLWSNSGVVTVA